MTKTKMAENNRIVSNRVVLERLGFKKINVSNEIDLNLLENATFDLTWGDHSTGTLLEACVEIANERTSSGASLYNMNKCEPCVASVVSIKGSTVRLKKHDLYLLSSTFAERCNYMAFVNKDKPSQIDSSLRILRCHEIFKIPETKSLCPIAMTFTGEVYKKQRRQTRLSYRRQDDKNSKLKNVTYLGFIINFKHVYILAEDLFLCLVDYYQEKYRAIRDNWTFKSLDAKETRWPNYDNNCFHLTKPCPVYRRGFQTPVSFQMTKMLFKGNWLNER